MLLIVSPPQQDEEMDKVSLQVQHPHKHITRAAFLVLLFLRLSYVS